jgi:hypothetical protein
VRIALSTLAAVLLASTAWSPPAAAETKLTPHKAEYKLSISVLGGQLNTELKPTADGYVATHVIKATGMSRILAGGRIAESSEFNRENDGIRPVSYSSNDTLTRDKIRANITFDWDNSEANGTVNDEQFHAAIEGRAYDRVSIQYELMSDLMNSGASEEYLLFDIDEIKTVSVHNIGQRTVTVPAGKFEAIGVQHQTPGSKRVTTMWCVKELDYLPVIVEQHRKGKLRMRAVLSNYEPLKT